MSTKRTSDSTPLAGHRVLVTRAAEQAFPLVTALDALGAEPVQVPTIELGPPASFAELDQAIADFTSAIKINPAYAAAYNNRGVVWLNRNNFNKAIADCGKAIEINPRYTKAFYNRGLGLKANGEVEQAVDDFARAIELQPNYAEAFNERGDCFIQIGQIAKGCDDLRRACELQFCTGLNLAKERNLCQ